MIDLNEVEARPRFDLDEIVRMLRATAEAWVPRHFPAGRREGNEWRVGNIRGGAPRKLGSCAIALTGEHAGDWIDFDGTGRGGPISALGEVTGLTSGDLYQYAADIAGISDGRVILPVPALRATTSSHPTESNQNRAQRVERDIAFILSHCLPVRGSPAETYLVGRGLVRPESPDLLFHPDLTYWDTRTGFPAIVALVRDVDGVMIAIHRTYLAPDGSGKADVPKQRMMLRSVTGGAVRLAEARDGLIGLAEGIETGLAVLQSHGALPVWATLSAGNLEQILLPIDLTRVVILADHDDSGAGTRAAERAAARLTGEGRRVWIALPPKPGDDFNDLLMKQGPSAVREAVNRAREWHRADNSVGPWSSLQAEPALVPIGFVEPKPPLPILRADDGDLKEATQRCWSALKTANSRPFLYRCAARASWVEPDDEGRPVPVPLTEDRLRHILALVADWRKQGKTGDPVPAHPSGAVVKNMLATADPPLPVLAGIVSAPVFGADGVLLTEPGYHPSSRLLYRPDTDFQLGTVPPRPNKQEIELARALLLEELLGDFPFVGEAERAHAVALLLLPFVRPIIGGPTPLHLIEKPTPGTGATLMVDAISHITTGRAVSVMVEGRDDEEWRKRITAKLRDLPSFILIDNLRRRLDSASVAAAITAPFWEDRILGRSEMARLPIRCGWIATGNNPQVSNEIARRIVRIRLDARVDQPWRRAGFRHPDLLTWVRQHRSQLVAACLTLGQAWIANGRPKHSRTIGSFEAWSEVMGGILDVAAVPGFLGNLDELYEAADAEGAVWRGFVARWWERHGTAEVGTADLYEIAAACEPEFPLGSGTERSQRTRLGLALRRVKDRVFGIGELRLRIAVSRISHQAQRWQLEVSSSADLSPT